MRTIKLWALLPVIVFGWVNASVAETYNFTCITGNNVGDCTIGETQLVVDVTDAGVVAGVQKVDFTFTNAGAAQSTISEIYFDDGTLLGIFAINSTAGVEFSEGATPPNLPGGLDPTVSFVADFAADADNPAPKKGVNAGGVDQVTITFDLINGKTYADTIDAMGTDLRIGLHVINFASGGSESFVAPAEVPVPAAAWLFGSALISLLGFKRKR
ncbi:hypothetical protein [Oceanicoccus sp. KOV_DT_Chl]|uniref:hypothetical protein n=1 Tax=Oceanicoccus sp. KOV_DT_Chl TaxID=1904639 RepID=UPI000C7D0690|nr:hypothetical protein [Oceanicoccus sp. KOV_DT_Chl]